MTATLQDLIVKLNQFAPEYGDSPVFIDAHGDRPLHIADVRICDWTKASSCFVLVTGKTPDKTIEKNTSARIAGHRRGQGNDV